MWGCLFRPSAKPADCRDGYGTVAVFAELAEQKSQIQQRCCHLGCAGVHGQFGICSQQPLQYYLPVLLRPSVPFLSPSLQRSLAEVLQQYCRVILAECNRLLGDVICPLPLVMAGWYESKHFATTSAPVPLYAHAVYPANSASVYGLAGITVMPMKMFFFRTSLALASGGPYGLRLIFGVIESLKYLV